MIFIFLHDRMGGVGNLQAKRYATSSAVASRPSSPGFFRWLTGERTSSFPSLDTPLEGVSLPPSLPDFVQPGKFKFTTLDNGIRIASETSVVCVDSCNLCMFCIIEHVVFMESDLLSLFFVASHLLEKMAFKSTKNRSHLLIIREVEAIGGNILASASREQMGYTFDALKTYVPEMVELLVDSLRNPVFLDWEVNEEVIEAWLICWRQKPLSVVTNNIVLMMMAINDVCYVSHWVGTYMERYILACLCKLPAGISWQKLRRRLNYSSICTFYLLVYLQINILEKLVSRSILLVHGMHALSKQVLSCTFCYYNDHVYTMTFEINGDSGIQQQSTSRLAMNPVQILCVREPQ
ncbi:hypothetical protein Q3G72_011979 [Acer saccharum]|nr:hypothetical protein Q3G72_011979 [Acer saccharum]